METRDKILEAVNDSQYIPQNPMAMYQSMGLEESFESFSAVLEELEKEFEIAFTKKGKIIAPAFMGLYKGKFMGTDRGFGFVRVEGRAKDIFIPPVKLGGAFNGDIVVVKEGVSPYDGRPEGEVIRIVTRGEAEFNATIRKQNGRVYAKPDDSHFGEYCDIYRKGSVPFHTGDKVWVKIVKYPSRREDAKVLVLQVFGNSDSLRANYLSVLHGYGIYEEFPAKALEEADAASKRGIIPADLNGRADLRKELIFTIDGADTKDIDDAISLNRDDKGRYVLGVHIADVSFYVKEGSELESEAYKRGTSVYFTDKVVPMLPKSLSNGICSLDQDKDRLAVSVFMTMDDKGEVIDYDIRRSIIRSVKKCVYSDLNSILAETAGDDVKAAYSKVTDTLQEMLKLSDIMYRRRIARGAIELETSESKILLDSNGEPTEIKNRERGVTERLIEEFMLAANETVARHLFWQQKPCLYRVHEEPNEEKSDNFVKMANAMGYQIRLRQGRLLSKEISEILKKAKGTMHEAILSAMVLRSLMKAQYSKTCAPHFGLASEKYCHFTSPIRRYPDLFVHRVLTLLLTNALSPKHEAALDNFAAAAGENSTEREIMADKAERDIDKLYMTAYMSKHVGEEFDGAISSVTSFGFFVELENTVEGLVHITTLNDDMYEFDDSRLSLTGIKTGKSYNIGESVKVVCIRADIASSEIDFALPEWYNENYFRL